MISLPQNIPQNKAGTVAYECLSYQQNAPVWAYIKDVFCGSESWLGRDNSGMIRATTKAQQYLPRWASEDDSSYRARLAATPFDDRFAQSLRKFVNFIVRNAVTFQEVPDSLQSQLQNPASDGSSFKAFVYQTGVNALRDGHALVLVDYPKANGQIRSQEDFERSGRRPYWVLYEASDLINYSTSVAPGGREELTLAVLRECVVTRIGEFQEELVTQYRVLRPGSWEVWQESKDDSGKVQLIKLDGGFTSLRFIPLLCVYGGLRQGFFTSRPALKALADLNVAHYQTRSDHRTKIHKCSLPVPVLKDSLRSENQTLVIGPDNYIHIKDPSGSFVWSEPLSTSLEQSRRECLQLEAAMDLVGAAYLVNPADRQAAQTTLAQIAELESSLDKLAADLSDGFSDVLRVHAAWLKVEQPGHLLFTGNVVKDMGRDSNLLNILSNLPERDLLSKRSFLEWCKRNEFLWPEFDIDQEIYRIGEQVDVKAGFNTYQPVDESLPPPPPVAPGDALKMLVDLAKTAAFPPEKVNQIIQDLHQYTQVRTIKPV